MLKINVFNRPLWLSSAAIGVLVSVYIGLLTYRQALPNLDSSAAVAAAREKLAALPSPLVADQIKPLDVSLSPYNSNILNARLLLRVPEIDWQNIRDPELLKLKDTYRETAARMLAVREYGIAISIFVGVLSIFLTTASAWVLLCSVWYAADKLKTYPRLA